MSLVPPPGTSLLSRERFIFRVAAVLGDSILSVHITRQSGLEPILVLRRSWFYSVNKKNQQKLWYRLRPLGRNLPWRCYRLRLRCGTLPVNSLLPSFHHETILFRPHQLTRSANYPQEGASDGGGAGVLPSGCSLTIYSRHQLFLHITRF